MVFFGIKIALLAVAIGGCSLIEKEDQADTQDVKPKQIHERKATVGSDVVVQNVRELVYGDAQHNREIVSGENRVVWLEGINPKTTRIQRPSERNASIQPDSTPDVLVRTYSFGVHDGALNVSGELALQNFADNGTSRFHVEFLHAGPMTGAEAVEMTGLWNKVAKRLVEKGMSPDAVIMGGHRYNQGVSAIVLIKVGV